MNLKNLLALACIGASSMAHSQTVLDHSKVIEPQAMSWADFPESTSFTDGIKVVTPDYSEPSVAAYLNVEYARKSGMPLHVTVLTPWPFTDEVGRPGISEQGMSVGAWIRPARSSRPLPTRQTRARSVSR